MYTVSGADNGKFVTDQYIPVKVLTANDGSAQFSTQQASVNGAINIVIVTAGGRGYFTTNGQFASVSNGASFSLANTYLTGGASNYSKYLVLNDSSNIDIILNN